MQRNHLLCLGRLLIVGLVLAAAPVCVAEEEPLAITHGPYLQAPGVSSMTIVWFTNKSGVAQVEYAPLASFADLAARKTVRMAVDGLVDANQTRHVVTLRGLAAGQAYGYRIQATEIKSFKPYKVIYGETVSMERMNDAPLSFVTLDPQKPRCSFSVVCDIHQDSRRLAAMLDHAAWPSTDFVALNGDMIHHLESEKQLFDSFLDVCVARFAVRTPMIYVRGNHETRGSMARQLRDYFPTPEGRYYYHFQQGPARVLVLDSGEDKPDDSEEYSGLVDFDPYRAEEAAWLKRAITEPDFQRSPYKVVLIHMPLFGGNNWYGERKNRELFLPLLNEAGIDLALSGHTHRYARIDAGQHANQFPIVIGDPQNLIRVDASPDGLNVVVQNADGSLKDEVHLPKRAKSQP